MRLLFIENRYTTWTHDRIARELERIGHDVFWLVQNPMFTPTSGTARVLPFPKRTDHKQDESLQWLAPLDRGVRWFGGDGSHWSHYDRHIRHALDAIEPDLIFGETTQFHELLTVHHARELGIPFLFPTGTRYPAGRFQFLAYDTLVPVAGAGTSPSLSELELEIDQIVNREIRPTYMDPSSLGWYRSASARLSDRTRVLAGWIRGERFVTPSPVKKLSLSTQHRRARHRWEALASEQQIVADLGDSWVLYPLQMQPETNIDVWGRPWSDQTELVLTAAVALQTIGSSLVVKPNPKSKYEMNDELCRVVESSPNVIALPHATPMRDIFPRAPVVLTVTGTILLESVFAGKPVASLGDHAMSRYPGVTPIADPAEIGVVMESVLHNEHSGASRDEALALLAQLYRTSNPAQVCNPVTQPDAENSRCVASLVEAYADAVSKVEAYPAAVTVPVV